VFWLAIAVIGLACGDPAVTTDCLDQDQDGYGQGAECLGPDCNDSLPGVHPGATEVCNLLDDDCDGRTDEDGACPTCDDQDEDGYGVGASCLGPDCRDREPTCHEGACCNQQVDCTDQDADGYGVGAECAGPDCDDANPACHTGMCCPGDCQDADGDGRGIGADCQGSDCDDSNALCWQGDCCLSDCSDTDGDGYGQGADCPGPDCDDGDGQVHPGAPEICNAIDDNCDGQTDEQDVCSGCVDRDGDGRGAGCQAGADCDDTDPACFEGGCCVTTEAWLELYVLDLWAQPLPEAETLLVITRSGAPVPQAGYPVVLLPLRQTGAYDIGLSAPEHEPLAFSVNYAGGADLGAVTLIAGNDAWGHGLSISHDLRDLGEGPVAVHTVYTGLRHKWFSAQGRPARRDNRIDLLINGEEAWARVFADLSAATEQVTVASWWWMSDFELVRPWASHATMSQAERYANTILGVLESIPAHTRILIGEFWGDNSIFDWLTTDDALLAHAQTPGDGFEFMGQGNPTSGEFLWELAPFAYGDRVRAAFAETAGRAFDAEAEINAFIPAYMADLNDWPFVQIEAQIASWHQKYLTIDHQVAFIGGMNVKSTDWDSQDQLVFDHRRMNYDASLADRQDVINKEREPDLGPRRDYMIRVEGPAAQDAVDIFQRRWSQAIADGVEFAGNSTDFTVVRDIPARASGKQVQVTATMPEPFWEHAIAETWFNAVAQAEDYIFIEDQYWRIPLLVDSIAARMRALPGLKLIVITKPVDEWLDPGCEWTHATHQQLLNEFGPNRYRTYQLIAFDSVVTWGWDETESRYANIDTHSKMLIVDDKFMSIGSCNKNNRGIIYEGELNVAVLDAAWVREQRRRIFTNILPAGTPPTDDVATWWQQLSDAAAWNDAVYDRWDSEGWDIDNGDGSGPLPAEYTPARFVHSLGFRTVDDCFFEGVGPDMTLSAGDEK
jgi:phosphatidylserine/phosphatidylglycerophosphate/cardiolipin synthase-like enzyme